MKILLDECVPVQVSNALGGHDVSTAQKKGWSGISNGELLQRAEQNGFELFIVADKNLRYQQNLKGRKLAILELWTNHRIIDGRKTPFSKTVPRPLFCGHSIYVNIYYRP